MADYIYPQDGKLHCRFSELVRCTPGQIDRVLAEREGRRRVQVEDMTFGIERHLQWEQEATETRRVPQCFDLDWPVSHVEHEFVTEILPGVVVHSRPDLVCAGKNILPDYKTVIDGKHGWQHNMLKYGWRPDAAVVSASSQRQLKFYAFQLGLHGIRIREGAFLCEIWNDKRDTILGYQTVRFDIPLHTVGETLGWIKPRIALLASALEQR